MLHLSVDVAADRQAISPYIYGMNFPSQTLAAELSLPVARWGGNSTSRYNWQTSITNTGSDYFYENVPYNRDTTRTLPAGSASDLFVEQNRRTNTASLITLPGLGLVTRADSPREHPFFCGFKVSVYGPQQAVDPWDPDCGNGIRPDGTLITNNDPNATSMSVNTAFVGAWINHLVAAYGGAAAGGVRFYGLDNEPMLWNETHRDIHPQPTSYAEVRDVAYTYGPIIKQHDPAAQILGPQLFGWTAYFYSALDWAAGGAWYTNPIDRNAHGGLEFSGWYLQEMQRYETQHGQRILDYFDLHYYPQASGITLAPAGDAATQARRLRSTRALWDASYHDESWISDGNPTAVQLLPRMRAWVDTYYPGTKLAISEYNWGAHEHINGALAQADVLGIFGREGLDLATLWGAPAPDQPAAFAFRMYRNYDGAHSTFGETRVRATSSNQNDVAIYAAQRADGALTVMVLNKTAEPRTIPVNIANFAATSVVGYSYNEANLQAIQSVPGLNITNNTITPTLPAQSINLFVLQAAPVTWTNQLFLPHMHK